jgi:hypothetical protein
LSTRKIDLGLLLVDHQLLDSEGRRCGNVDELALEGGPGEVLEVVAILSGPGTWRRRAGWLGRLAAWIGGGGTVRIPWEDVDTVAAHVRLRKRAETLGLGRGDDRLRPFIERIPGADR